MTSGSGNPVMRHNKTAISVILVAVGDNVATIIGGTGKKISHYNNLSILTTAKSHTMDCKIC